MRPKLFLTFALLCVTPLIFISALASFLSFRNVSQRVRTDLQSELSSVRQRFEDLSRQHRHELETIAQNAKLVELVRAEGVNPTTIASGQSTAVIELLRDSVTSLLVTRPAYSSVVCLDRAQQVLFSANRSAADPHNISFETKSSQGIANLESIPKPDECVGVSSPATGEILRCAIPIRLPSAAHVGSLISDIRLDVLSTNIARDYPHSLDTQLTVLQRSGKILYHSNDAVRHQSVNTVLPEFRPVAEVMMAGETGEQFYRGPSGDEWFAAYGPLTIAGLSAAVGVNYSSATRAVRRNTWLLLGLAFLFGLGLATVMSVSYQRLRGSIKRVTKDVTAIAAGDLDKQIEARSRDDIRDLAQGVNLVTTQLREQLARETELRQIESFVGVAAMLTHDLKNAINGLSMYVANLESQFDSPTFRAESIEALTDATQRLQSLVDRLSNPVTTLSGEYKRPTPTDLAPLVKQVVARTTGLGNSLHEIDVQLPASLVAVVDGERIETVIENLVRNAMEAMADKPGKLTISGSDTGAGKVVLIVSDTGAGMTERFIEQKLFHAFATTKKKGMGLGLYTCREVVTANGGTIEVTSKVGVGTSFRVMLPSPTSNTAEA